MSSYKIQIEQIKEKQQKSTHRSAALQHFTLNPPLYGNCEINKQNDGMCIPLTGCPSLHTIVYDRMTTWQERETIRDSLCGHANGSMLYCCPRNDIQILKLPTRNDDDCGVWHQMDQTVYVYRHRQYTTADFGEFPWSALLSYTNDTFKCNGVLITNRYVLTTSDCLRHGNLLAVQLGGSDYKKLQDCSLSTKGYINCAFSPPMTYEIESIKVHDDIDSFVLIHLNSTVNFTMYIKPICLPQIYTNNYPNVEETLFITGWISNRTDKLKVSIPGKLIPGDLYVKNSNSDHWCVGNVTNTCHIPGGQLMRLNTNKSFWILVGLYNRAIVRHSKTYILFTCVEKYMEWIVRNID